MNMCKSHYSKEHYSSLIIPVNITNKKISIAMRALLFLVHTADNTQKMGQL